MASARDKIRKIIEENLVITFNDHESMSNMSQGTVLILKERIDDVVDLIIDAVKDSDKVI